MFELCKKDFPLLAKRVHDKPIVYVDNAATTQKPRQMIDAISEYYQNYNAPVYRAVYSLAEESTQLFENARTTVAQYVNARKDAEIVFTKGSTEGINMVAFSWAVHAMQEGDEVLLTEFEHHSNLLPWQRLAFEKNITLSFIPLLDNGTLDMDALRRMITPKTKLVSVVHVSNAIGTHVDVTEVTRIAHAQGARILVDASQSAGHQKIDVQSIDCDFLVLSGHKMMGPTGIGVLYIKHELYDAMQPWLLGGGMVSEVAYHKATYANVPQKFEAGTPPVAQAIGLAAAIKYIKEYVNFDDLKKHEASLCSLLIAGLKKIEGIRILGPIEQLQNQGHLVSFVHESIHAHDIAAYLDQYGICVRTGHFCVQPLAKKLGIESAVRVSFYLYNTPQEVEYILSALQKAVQDLA